MSSASIEASEKKWSSTAQLYIHYFEPHTVTMGYNLLTSLKLRFSTLPLRVIECGSGAGAVAMEISRLLALDDGQKHDHKLTMVDLSESMMEIAHKRILDSCSLQPVTLVADATSLPFPDGSFDRYISNMTVHYAPDADAFLREAGRVLSSGGLAGFTVWGHEDLSPAFTLLPSIKMKLGLVKERDAGTTPPRSSYHMGEDDEALRQRVMAAGFSHCVIWHAPSVIEAISAESFVDTMIEGSFSTKQEYLGWPEDVRVKFRSEVLTAANALLERGQPLVLDVCYCIAQK